jgi:hypothetical protein
VPIPIEHAAVFEDVVAVARSAGSASSGWRAICVRARRRLGAKIVQPLSALDLDADSEALGRVVRVLVAKDKIPREVDTLHFGLFDGVDDDRGAYAGYYVAGLSAKDGGDERAIANPVWLPRGRYLRSPSLDAIVHATARLRGEPRKMVEHSLRFGAAALVGRFSAAGLGYRVLVGFDDGDFAEVVSVVPGALITPASTSRP